MESFLESAIKIEDPQARLAEFRDIREWLDNGACPDLKEKVEAKIQEAEEYIRTALQEKAEYETELEVSSPKDLKEKLTSLAEDTKILKEESTGWKDISVKLQEKYDAVKSELDSRPTAAYASWLKEKNTALKADLASKSEKMKQVVSDLIEAYENLKADNAKLVEANEKSAQLVQSLKKDLQEKTQSDAESSKMNEALETSTLKVSKALKEANAKIAKMQIIMESQRKQIEAYVEKERQAIKLAEARKVENSKLNSQVNTARQKAYGLLEERRHEAELRGETTVSAYFNKLYESYGNSVVPFEKRLKACKTLSEAKQYFFKNVLPNMTESREIDALRIPETLGLTPEDRKQKLGEKNFRQSSMYDRMPEGWI
jgi:chromosome segregation ATPase